MICQSSGPVWATLSPESPPRSPPSSLSSPSVHLLRSLLRSDAEKSRRKRCPDAPQREPWVTRILGGRGQLSPPLDRTGPLRSLRLPPTGEPKLSHTSQVKVKQRNWTNSMICACVKTAHNKLLFLPTDRPIRAREPAPPVCHRPLAVWERWGSRYRSWIFLCRLFNEPQNHWKRASRRVSAPKPLGKKSIKTTINFNCYNFKFSHVEPLRKQRKTQSRIIS